MNNPSIWGPITELIIQNRLNGFNEELLLSTDLDALVEQALHDELVYNETVAKNDCE